MPDWPGLLTLDAQRVWHPYAAMPGPRPSLPVVGAEGVRIELADGRQLIDGMASWWCAVHGYRQPLIDEAIRSQIDRFSHVMFGGLTHEPAIELADRLVALAPAGLEHVFFADSGSVAVEVAIKMCLQAQRARRGRGVAHLGDRGEGDRSGEVRGGAAAGRGDGLRLLTIRGGYHGDTLGAMAVCDPVDGMHALFAGSLAEHVFAKRPPDGFDRPLDTEWAKGIEALVEAHAHELAGVIVEPVVQGAGGMRFHSPGCVALMRRVCDEHGLLLILDEIATSFGRTGAMFACEHAGVSPDVMCVGKALTGGYMSLAATLCTAEVAAAIRSGEGGALMHGPTYMGNALACSAALASLRLLESGAWREQVRAIEAGLRAGLAPARQLPGVADVRVLGAIGVIELKDEVDVAAATEAAIGRGVWLRPFRDLIYAMPAYVMSERDVATVAEAMVAAAEAGSGA